MAFIIVPGRSIPERPTFELPRLNRDSPQAEGLVGWWPLTIKDGRNYAKQTGSILVGDINFETGPVLGPAFSGWSTSNYINTGLNASDATWTFALWVERTAAVASDTVFVGDSDNSPAEGWRAWADNSGFYTLDISGNTRLDSNHTLTVGETRLLTFRYDGTNAAIFIDGLLDNEAAKTFTPTTQNRKIFFGAGQRNNLPDGGWNQPIGHALYYDCALTNNEIFSLFHPRTRWDLYDQDEPKVFIDLGGQQFARPFADITFGGWAPEFSGSPSFAGSPTELWPMIDESVADDTDFIHSGPAPSDDTCEVRLEELGDPASSANHVVRYRYAKNVDEGRIDLTVRLMEGAVERASWTHTDISATLTTAEQTLSAAQADSIGSYGNLRLRFTADQPT